MRVYYRLTHQYKKESWVEADVKCIGFFESLEIAQAALEKVKDQPGFRDWPDNFRIDELELDKIDWKLIKEAISPFDLPQS